MKKMFLMLALVLTIVPVGAVCTAHSTGVDAFYSNNNAAALKSFTKGYTWTAETTAAGVVFTFVVEDTFTGLANPYLMLFDDKGVLIGNVTDHAMQWTESTQTATITLSGYNAGDEIVCCLHMAYAGGLFYTERVDYIVGSACTADEEPEVLGECSGLSKGVDPTYTDADPAAANPWVNGYEWTCTTTNEGVEIAVEFNDYLPGMSTPYIFIFKEGTDEVDGGDKPMKFVGSKASYTVTDRADGSELKFMVKVAYELHVAFTEKITYTVGEDCRKAADWQPIPTQHVGARKIVENGQVVILHDGKRFNILGVEIK